MVNQIPAARPAKTDTNLDIPTSILCDGVPLVGSVGGPGDPSSTEDEFVLADFNDVTLLKQPFERFDQIVRFDSPI